jgi:alpha-ketoglutarate-dependent taurine dioxygenase
MKLDIEPVDATFGAIVRGIKVNSIDDATWRKVYDAWLEYALLIFPGQNLTRDEQKAFARRFGQLEYEMLPITNLKTDGTLYSAKDDAGMLNLLQSTYSWHSDSTYTPVQAKGAVFCADVLPKGGTQTGWADMRAAYDVLDAATKKKVEGLTAYHSFSEKQKRMKKDIASSADSLQKVGGVEANAVIKEQRQLRPLVKVHPETGRKCLLIGLHLCEIPGMAQDEADAFLDGLVEAACQPPRTFYYEWTSGDAVLWDNRCLLHRAVPWDFFALPRVMWHSRIAGDPVAEAALT